MSLNKSNYLLTFEWDSDNETLEIHGNEKGLEKLKILIDSIIAKKNNDHIHLMTQNWGGDELSDNKQCSENILINHVKLFKWVQVNK